jgi:16S rRNA (cytosine967-C5)-methyltransferase
MSATRIAPQRRAAYEVLRRVFEHGAWADRAFPAAAERHGLDARERSQAQRLAYGSVQRRGTSDHLIAELARRPPSKLDPSVLAALRLGLFEIAFADATPDHAVVDQAVELAKGGGERRRRAGAGLVNAVLRRAAAAGDLLGGLDDDTPEGASALHSFPVWLVRMWWDELGPASARSLLAASNDPPETALRVNGLKAGAADIRDQLLRSGEALNGPMAPGPLAPPEAVVVGSLTDAVRRRVADGHLVPQSRASQAVGAVLDPQPGQRVLDLCAAPGIKTTAIAARMGNRGEIVAVERDPGRARELRDTCERLGATCVRVVEGDAAKVDVGDGYDRILVDPPCSDLGTLASRPDARWRKSPELIDRLAGVQEAILARAAIALAPGGALVYSTCTVSAREGEDRIASLVASGGEIEPVDLGKAAPELASQRDPRFLQTRPDRDRTDGFFIARLEG